MRMNKLVNWLIVWLTKEAEVHCSVILTGVVSDHIGCRDVSWGGGCSKTSAYTGQLLWWKHVCKQLAQIHYVKMERPLIEPGHNITTSHRHSVLKKSNSFQKKQRAVVNADRVRFGSNRFGNPHNPEFVRYPSL